MDIYYITFQKKKFDGSRRGNKSTRHRAVIQRYLYSDSFFPQKEAPKAMEDDFDKVVESADFVEFQSTSASVLKPFFFQKSR